MNTTEKMGLSVRIPKANDVTRALARTMTCGMLLILSACGIPNLRQPESAPGLPGEFDRPTRLGPDEPSHVGEGNSADNSSTLRIEEFYGDPMLSGLIYQALAGNRELKILDEEVQIARNEILARSGAYLPFVGLGSSAGVYKYSYFTLEGADNLQVTAPGPRNFPVPLPNFYVGPELTWQIDIWRQLRNARDAAAQRYAAAIDHRSYFVTRLVAEVAENYYRLMAQDKRLANLDRTIELQKKSLDIAIAKKAAGRGTELGVQRFRAEVSKNESEKLIVNQDIIEAENRINFLLNRFPQPVERATVARFFDFFDLNIHALSLGVPSQLLENRPDIRQAERELAAAGLDVRVARARFFPVVTITGGVGYQAFNPSYLFMTPESLIAGVAGNLVAPLINKRAIQADYMSANARQLQAVYNYQRTILNAFTEVINRVAMVENFSRSIGIKKQQLRSLEAAVDSATDLFQKARAEYIDVLFAQRDMMDARMVLIDTKKEQLAAIVKVYQALGGGDMRPISEPVPLPPVGFRGWLRRLCGKGGTTDDLADLQASNTGAVGAPATYQVAGQTSSANQVMAQTSATNQVTAQPAEAQSQVQRVSAKPQTLPN